MPIQELIMNRRNVRVGSRASDLAMKQTNMIISLLSKTHTDITFEVITMETNGDKVLEKEFKDIGDKNLFIKELEIALLNREVDFVVHSLKDVPTSLASEFSLGCVCMRESVEDAVIMKEDSRYTTLEDLPEDSLIGTSSVRRIAQLKRKYPHLKFAAVRGNVNSRLKKLDAHATADINETGKFRNFAALILAKAGLERIGLKGRISQVLSTNDNLYAVGQGALACECLAGDTEMLRLLSTIHDGNSGITSIAERSLLRQFSAGCSVPIAVRSSLTKEGLLTLEAVVMSADGSEFVKDESCMLLPEEDHEEVLDEMENGDDDNTNDDLPLVERIKLENPSFCDITNREIQLGKDQKASFLGVRVSPICEIDRLRMAVSERLGLVLSKKLVAAGAGKILEVIQKAREESEKLARNVDSKQIF